MMGAHTRSPNNQPDGGSVYGKGLFFRSHAVVAWGGSSLAGTFASVGGDEG